MHKVHCVKLNMEAKGLDAPPFPTALGQRIYDNISKLSWDMWLEHQTILINEYKLNLLDKKSRDFLQTEMKKFLFNE